MLTANEIRQQFIDFFFKKHGHSFVPSSSVVPLDDPTLMFANAGMNQFKDVFLGTGTRPYRRAANSQKCIRAGGKHNDLEDVGRDTYHHTFFEMLGNWSFGDYFKKEAIAWAWELLTGVWGLDKARLHVTVFEGDASEGLAPDDDAAELWRTQTDIDPSHIHRGSKKDNFWEMGETGPCGPCSEIHIDRTPDRSGSRLVNAGRPEVIEIWNLVFIHYNRGPDRKLTPLPARHVDTGMGFERITAVVQGKGSNYDTDVFSPIMDAIGKLTGKKYGGKLDDMTDVAFRVIADHLRMLTFAITDGALPGNKGRGSVLRSVLRRAVRFGWQRFNQREPFVHKLVPVLVEHMGAAYPELKANPGRVMEVIRGEEADFLRTIARGLSLFEEAAKQARQHADRIDGKAIFDLHTENGFPPDLTRQMAQERGLTLDMDDYERRMREHEDISRHKDAAQQVALNVGGGLPETDDRPKWFGPRTDGVVQGWVSGNHFCGAGTVPAGQEVGLILDRSCFYAEAGGQVGDKGIIRTPTGVFEVTQAVKTGNSTVHLGRVSSGCVEVGQTAQLEVDPQREFTRKNHTATHLLHWALQKVLGEHVEQRGSKVKPDEFTFDFSHTGPVTEAEKAEVERLVNEKVYQDLPVAWRELSIAEARKLPGVRAFFGDKYGDVVRVVEVGDGFSREFCGGTHLDHTGQIGFFKIVGEEGVGKGVRRLTCVTAREAVAAVQKEDAILADLAGRFRCKPEELPARVEGLQEELKKLQQQLKKGAVADLQGAADQLLASAAEVGGTKIIVGEMPAGTEEQMRQQIDRLRQKAGSAVVLVGWSEDSKVQLIAAVTDDLVKKGLHAGKLVGQVAKVVGGGGGGKPTLAQAGGKEPGKLADALQLARELAREQLAR
ncbi:MAG TPA: alanine--tRNA ligase [Gemmataceae bacterium]|nr:alanine--tRNA ligase [Gemmataceae bacterium]